MERPSLPLRVPIDPRIRERRIEVRRRQTRRRLRFLVAGTVVVVLSAGGWFAVRSPLLDIDTVRVEGATRTPAEAVIEAGGIQRGVALLDLDEGAAEARIEALPWVAEAEVQRRWPGTVSVAVVERSPLVTTVDEAGTWWLLDRSGRVLDRSESRPEGLLEVAGLGVGGGPGSEAAGAEGALQVVSSLSPHLAGRVSAVAVSENGEIELRVNPQGTVRLGPPVEVDAKLRAVETVLASVDVGSMVVLDVRLPASPVLVRA